jgi:GTPase
MLPPEDQYGCIEYKWKLSNISDEKINKLTTQMNWRLIQESDNYSVLYIIGVLDNGVIKGISRQDFIDTYIILMTCARKINSLSCIRTMKKFDNKYWGVIQIFKNFNINKSIDIPKIPVHVIPNYIVDCLNEY